MNLWNCNIDSQCQRLVPQAPHRSTRIHNPPYPHLPNSKNRSNLSNTNYEAETFFLKKANTTKFKFE